MITLPGYYFAATGISSYAFFDGDRCVCRVDDTVMPGEAITILSSHSLLTADTPPDSVLWTAVRNGTRITEVGGNTVAEIFHFSPRHFTLSQDGKSIRGRLITKRLRNYILYTDMDDEEVGRVEYRLDRNQSREQFGEWFPQRYEARVKEGLGEVMTALMLAVPFLDIEGIEVGPAT